LMYGRKFRPESFRIFFEAFDIFMIILRIQE
jgi:hypothetical protein